MVVLCAVGAPGVIFNPAGAVTMSYTVLARKYRPMVFEDVMGQEHVTRTLMNALRQQRIAHAYIFAGPRGVGKTTTARLLAKAVNCQNQPAVNPCNTCESCRAITEGRSLDVIEIDGASNRGIDEIRNLRENIRFSPATARYKIYIIDEVHMLTKEAFNALLKTLEEPPEHAIFIFATTEIHKVPLTILSRCQRFDFKRIATKTIIHYLQQVAAKENIAVDEDSLLLIARKAEGGMRDALSILDQLIAFTDGKLSVEKVRESLGLINEELYFELSDALLQKADHKIIDFVYNLFAHGHDSMDFLYGLQTFFRNLLIVKTTGNTQLLETADVFKKRYHEYAGKFDTRDLLQFIDLLINAETTLKYSPNPQLVLEVLLLKLAYKPRAVDLQELLQFLKNSEPVPRVGSSQHRAGTQTVPRQQQITPPSQKKTVQPPKASTPTEPSNILNVLNELETLTGSPSSPKPPHTPPLVKNEATQLSLQFVKEHWASLVEAVRRKKIVLGNFLQEGIPYALKNGAVEIAFDHKNSFHQKHVNDNLATIETIAKELWKSPIRFRCISIDFKAEGLERPHQSAEEMLKDLQEKEPLLKKIIETFDLEPLDEND